MRKWEQNPLLSGRKKVMVLDLILFGGVKSSLQKGNKEVPLRVNPEPLGLSSGRRQVSLFRPVGRRVDFGGSISYKI